MLYLFPENNHSRHTPPKTWPIQIEAKISNFIFSSSFSSPVGLVFHPRSHFLYAYGNQVRTHGTSLSSVGASPLLHLCWVVRLHAKNCRWWWARWEARCRENERRAIRQWIQFLGKVFLKCGAVKWGNIWRKEIGRVFQGCLFSLRPEKWCCVPMGIIQREGKLAWQERERFLEQRPFLTGWEERRSVLCGAGGLRRQIILQRQGGRESRWV